MSSEVPVATKSKAELKAERRAKQEAQRAAKAAAKGLLSVPGSSGKPKQSSAAAGDQNAPKKDGKLSENKGPRNTNVPGPASAGGGKGQKSGASAKSQQKQQYTDTPNDQMKKLENNFKEIRASGAGSKTEVSSSSSIVSVSVHPAFIQLGLQSANGTIYGTDARCVALISAFKKFIMDYKKPEDKAFARDIESAIRPHVSHLSGGHPLPPSIGNLVKQLKHQMTNLPNDISEKEGRSLLCEWLDEFAREKIQLAFEAISINVREKLRERPIIMTYSWCPIIEKILIDAKRNHLDFRVVIIDSVPEQSGKKLLRNLLKWDMECSYALLNSLAYAIQECKLVLVGADALLANGSFIGHLGTSQVALIAQSCNVPVLAVCPTYKFAEKVQTGTLEPETESVLSPESLEMIPADLVSGVVTELRILPPSSVPAVLRVKQIL